MWDFKTCTFWKGRKWCIFFSLFEVTDLLNSVTQISREQTLQTAKNLMQIYFTVFQVLHTKHKNQFLTAPGLFLNWITINPSGTKEIIRWYWYRYGHEYEYRYSILCHYLLIYFRDVCLTFIHTVSEFKN